MYFDTPISGLFLFKYRLRKIYEAIAPEITPETTAKVKSHTIFIFSYRCIFFASILKVACGTALSLSLGINFPVTLQIP
jgi:hypothetical protein